MRILKSLMRISVLMLMFFAGAMFSCSGLKTQDEKFEKYVDKFGKEIGIEKDELSWHSVKFATLLSYGNGAAGLCNLISGNIYIDPDFWYHDANSEIIKKAVIYHELAHCVCWANHVKGDKDGCPISMMNAYLPTKSCLEKNWDMYIKDLKKRCE